MIKILAPAKVNLYLEILNRRPDAYHNLKSVMQAVSLFDELTFEAATNGITLKCLNANLPCNEENLVYKAAQSIKEKFNITQGVNIILTKNIPSGAGLGGGSSDAAATINALVKLWGIQTDFESLRAVASKLGADVAFFLEGGFTGTALAQGIGDIITPVQNAPKTYFLLINPRVHVSTPSVYKRIKFPLTNEPKKIKIEAALESFLAGNLSDISEMLFNRLEDFVLPYYPQIKEIKTVLKGFNVPVLMSGSGATVFAVSSSKKETESLQSKLHEFPWDVWQAESLNS
jgi:4-diphosphocytidyl-2-C-methyl-D-erythritol kinase